MEVPRGFTRCDECEGKGEVEPFQIVDWDGNVHPMEPCPSCAGSGLRPTEKLREDVAGRLRSLDLAAYSKERYYAQADAVLRKVAEHIGEER